jgi:hypothetical protein
MIDLEKLEKLKADRDAALADCDRLFSAALADFRAVMDAKMLATRAEINAAFDAAFDAAADALAAQAKETPR